MLNFKKRKLGAIITLVLLVLNVVVFSQQGPVQAATPSRADILFTVGTTTTNSLSFVNDLKAALVTKGIDASRANIVSVNQSSVNTSNAFAWDTYDHIGNWGEDPYPAPDTILTNHIAVKNGGKDMTFYGYGQPGYTDYMFMPDANASKKTFTFDLDEDNINSHSMEGGGFLFNTVISAPGTTASTISGYVLLYTPNGLVLYKVDNAKNDPASGTPSLAGPGNTFHDQTKSSSLTEISGVTQLGEPWAKGEGTKHSIKIEATPTSLNLWDNNVKIIDNYSLPSVFGNGFGPIASYRSHGCNELSYFNFTNLSMSMLQEIAFKDVVANASWSAGTSRFIVNLTDSTVPDFNDAPTNTQILNNMASNKVHYLGWGRTANQAQALNFITQNGTRGIYADNTDYTNSVDQMATYIANVLKAADAAAAAAEAAGNTPPPAPPAYPGKMHQLTSAGDLVKLIQARLNELGMNSGPVDGIFGEQTRGAVLRFQAANGLAQDGVVGPLTWAKLFGASSQAPAPAPTGNPYPGLVKYGDNNANVGKVQARLTALGIQCGPTDGIFLNQTLAGVKNFQTSKGLVADGIVGPITWAALFN